MSWLEGQHVVRPRRQRRTIVQIKFDTLQAVFDIESETGYEYVIPTRVMYRANLASTNLGRIRADLLNLGLLSERPVGARKVFTITENGKEALRLYQRAIKLVGE